jgi:hypothetical protein
MKKVLLTLLGIIVVVGVLAGAGFAGYRIGYMQAATANANGVSQPALSYRGFGLQGMPMHNFGNDFDERGFNNVPGHQGFGMMDRGRGGRGFGFMSPLFFLLQIAFWALVIWLAYMAIKGSGWKLSLTRQKAEVSLGEVTASSPDEQSPKTDG